MTDKVLDVAIIGAGAAGIYAGWRLKTQSGGSNRRVAIFEAEDRVGGRIYSVTPPGLPNVKAEFGARRILPASEQPRINLLIEKLNEHAPPDKRIETFALPDDTPPENVAYLRGSHLRREDFSKAPGCEGAKCVPYQVGFTEKAQTPDGMMLKALEQLVPGITDPNLSPSQRRAMARDAIFDGRPLYAQGFEQVLLRVLSHEAYEFVTKAGGYESSLLRGNAADAVAAFPATLRAAKESRGFTQGFQQVPRILVERFKQAGGELHCNRPLAGFEWKHGIAELHFRDHPTVQAKSLVLAVPPLALKSLAVSSPLLREEIVSKLLGTVTVQQEAHLFTQYEDTWWKAAGVEKGSTVTDLPVSKVTFWSAVAGSGLQEAVPAPVMYTYAYPAYPIYEGYTKSVDFGRAPGSGSAERAPHPGRFVGFRERIGQASEVDPEWSKNAPPAALVEDTQRQYGEIYDMKYVEPVKEAAYKSWENGMGAWNPGVNSAEVIPHIIKPDPGVYTYIVNADYSGKQGTVEGALEVVDQMLDVHFHIKPLVAEEEPR